MNYTQKVQIKAVEHRRLLVELKELAVSVQRCQDTITSLITELNAANAKFQGERSTQQGTGIGLVISRRLYDELGGHRTATDPEANLIARLGRRRMLMLRSGARST